MKSLLQTVDETIRGELSIYLIDDDALVDAGEWATRVALAWLLKRARRDEGEVDPQGVIPDWLEAQINTVLKEIDDT